MFPFPHAY
ncbi:Protein of unknown function [Bacillus wiedmannii]|uniref:Uncharacterized protein n=2 Tax=Bacillus cereus group TaxID=86661 RepID=A0A1C4F1H7_BACTU|nr:Protein of unknown function [Bacillus wiedmannii]SCC49686.1 Protein of unknown function [Bacillus thuringiensis]SCM02041.1 Protein of unknown function [Bacillus wiedmannii]SCN10338.1 Protein of unknown function [Bacillus wiedmannii]